MCNLSVPWKSTGVGFGLGPRRVRLQTAGLHIANSREAEHRRVCVFVVFFCGVPLNQIFRPVPLNKWYNGVPVLQGNEQIVVSCWFPFQIGRIKQPIYKVSFDLPKARFFACQEFCTLLSALANRLDGRLVVIPKWEEPVPERCCVPRFSQ